MNIEIIHNNNEVNFKVDGTLTSENYMELDNAFVNEGVDYNKYVLDFSLLEYITSAGLRAVLAEEKRLKVVGKHLIIRGCNKTIMNIFDVCGFSEILTFEEELPLIDTSKFEIIGEGLCAKVYKAREDTIIKVYEPRLNTSMIEKEKKNAREALIAGVPTAISLDVIKTMDGRSGIIFEMLNATSLKSVLKEDKEHRDEWVKKYVELVKTVHSAEGNKDSLEFELDKQKSEAKRCIYLTDQEKEKALKLLDSLDYGHTCIHGDLHAGNVMVSNGELLFIDMGDFGIGHPYQDLAQIHNILANDVVPGFGKLMTGLEKDDRKEIYDLFMNYYFDNPTPEQLKEYEKEIVKYEIAKHFFYINEFPDTREPNLKFVKDYLSNI